MIRPAPAASFAAGAGVALAAGWLAFPRVLYVKGDQPLAFNHAVHVQSAGLACEDCHVFRADGTFGGVPGVAKCAECHAEAIGKSESEKTLVESFVTPGREVPWLRYAAQPDNVHFPHVAHVRRASLDCARCHGPHGATTDLRPFERNRISGYSRDIWGPSLARIGRQTWQGMKMSDCLACHREHGRGETACLDCHK